VKHSEAKEIVDGFLGVSPVESLFTRAVAWHETNYGAGWKEGEGAGSNNMGAITTANPDSLSFKHVDSRWDAKKGKKVEYTTWFKGYPDATAGLRDLARTVLKDNVRAALSNGDVPGAVEGMYANKYFLGIHPDDASNIADYQDAASRALSAITAATGEPPIVPLALAKEGRAS
jgi:hypothetical protein